MKKPLSTKTALILCSFAGIATATMIYIMIEIPQTFIIFTVVAFLTPIATVVVPKVLTYEATYSKGEVRKANKALILSLISALAMGAYVFWNYFNS